MIRSELLGLIIILVFINPLESRLYQSPENLRERVEDSWGTRRRNHLPLLQNLDERLSRLMSDLDRGPGVPVRDLRGYENTQNGRQNIWDWVERKRNNLDMEVPESLAVSEDLPTLSNDVTFSLQKRRCDSSRFTIQTLIEYLQTGRICGRRVAHVRFGLGGRKR